MNLNPVVVIPTYWCGKRRRHSVERGVAYDHMTPIYQEGELGRCLESLIKVEGLGRIVVLVASEPGVENQAVERVRQIVSRYTSLDVVVIGEVELGHIHRYLDANGLGGFDEAASLTGYGAIKNLGILVASIFGHDTVIFLDDDEIVTSTDFLERAVHGIAMKTPNGAIITAKSGYFLDTEGRATSPDRVPWTDRFWNKAKGFNAWIEPALKGPRLSRANVACGGCMVLHADCWGTIAFDPWIARGEDLDYVLSAHMYGVDLWFDNKLSVDHRPPADAQHPARFEQDVRRWFYELRKIEYAKTQIDLMQVSPRALEPYPGPWLTPSTARRARLTALLRAIGNKNHLDHWRICTRATREAGAYAREMCGRYFELEHRWPAIVRAVWQNTPLATQLSGARAVASSASTFTGRLTTIDTGE